MLVVTSWSACLDGDFDGKIGCVLISDSVKPQVACHAHGLRNLGGKTKKDGPLSKFR